MSWSEIRTLDASGFVDIESHTVDHPDLTTLDAATLAAELANSKNTIEQQLNLNKQPSRSAEARHLSWPTPTALTTTPWKWRLGRPAIPRHSRWDDAVEMTAADKFALDRLQMDQQTSVQLDTSGWYEFFLNRMQDPDVQIPSLSITGIQYLDPTTHAPLDIANIQPGQSVLIHVDVNNAASPAPVIASLALDSDADHSGVIYDSHVTTPVSQDIHVTCPWGASSFEWTWTVPATAPAGQYYAQVTFNDPKYVVSFKNSQWQTAFQVVQPMPSPPAAKSAQRVRQPRRARRRRRRPRRRRPRPWWPRQQ